MHDETDGRVPVRPVHGIRNKFGGGKERGRKNDGKRRRRRKRTEKRRRKTATKKGEARNDEFETKNKPTRKERKTKKGGRTKGGQGGKGRKERTYISTDTPRTNIKHIQTAQKQ